MKNNYVFFGSPEFAAYVLNKLIAAGASPKLIISNPDRPQGRKMKLTPPQVKAVAEENKVPIWQPESIASNELQGQVGGAELGLVAAYSQILKKDVLGSFSKGILGLHPSLLPKYRGASPIQSALLAGEKGTGISLYLIDEKVDHGPVLAQKKIKIEDADDYFSLEKKLAEAGAELFLDNLPKLFSGEATPLPQDESQATFTKKYVLQDAFINPEEILSARSGNQEKSLKIWNAIRAFAKEPVAWTYGSAFPKLGTPQDKRIKLLKAEIKNGTLKILRIQTEGKLPRNL